MSRSTTRLRTVKFLAGLAAAGSFFSGSTFADDGWTLRQKYESRKNGSQTSPPVSAQAATQSSVDPSLESPTAANGQTSTELKLNFFAKTWDGVLGELADQAGMTLVADRFPAGKFSRQDFRGYTLNEALRIVNQELEKQHFRVLPKGRFLVLIDLASARPEYQRPILDAGQANAHIPLKTAVSPLGGAARSRAFENAATTIEPASNHQVADPSSGSAQDSSGPFRAGARQFAAAAPNLRSAASAFDDRDSGSFEQASPFAEPKSGASAQQFAARREFAPPRQFEQQSPFQRMPELGRQPEPARHPQLARQPQQPMQEQQATQEIIQQPATRRDSLAQRPARGASQSAQPSAAASGYRTLRPGAIRQVGYQGDDQPGETAEQVVRQSYKPTNRPARSLSSLLYGAFRDQTKLVERGPDGLPAMQVFASRLDPANPDAPLPAIVFTVAVDTESDELIVEGPATQVGRIVRLLQRLDTPPAEAGESTRVVATEKNASDVVKTLQPAVNQMAAQNAAAPGAQPPTAVNRKDEAGNDLPDVIGGIRGDVAIEAVEGMLVIKGNQADVDAVMEIIRQIEALSAKSAPDIHLRLLQSVDGQALAELLTTVYNQLNEARGGGGVQDQQQISIFAVGRPNAVLVLASEQDLQSVLLLIDELDKPVEPQTSFAVFTLQHAIASQVEAILEDFYSNTGAQGTGQTAGNRTGLSARVRVVTDVRTNTLVVLAQPNDLAEIEKVILKLDRADSGAVSELKVFELRHAVAEELAQTLQSLIQATLNPPTTGQGQGFGGFGQNTGTQQLRDVRSTVLEYLHEDGGSQMKYRSGILSDIRFSGDPRSNTLLVTAPRESMGLIAQLVKRLDRAASSVATIKHFALKNADATSTTDLLNNLFGTETTTQNQQVGVQLAGAENAPSVVPLKFSVDTRTNSIVAVGTAESLEVVEALIYRLDSSDLRTRETTIIRMKNSPATDIASAVGTFLTLQTNLLQTAGTNLISAFEFIDQQVIIQAEPYTNSLLISATPRYFETVREMVLKLDAELPQVVIQVMLVEVTLDNQDEFGIELGLQDSILFNRGLTGVGANAAGSPGFNFNNNGLPTTSAAGRNNVAGQALADFGLGRANTELGFGGLVMSAGNESVSVLLRALSQNRHVEVLSRPQVRTLDNRPALIRVAQEVPRINGFTTTQTGQVNPVVEQAEAGIILSVTPTISPDGNILMSVTAEKSNIDPTVGVALFRSAATGDIVSPIKNLTQAQSTVVVPDEQTIVLGGLITREITDVERKVPWLGDIPYLGQAFRYDQHSNVRKELLIFLTPRIVKGDSHSEATKHIEAQRIHFDETGAEEIYGPLYGIPTDLDQWKRDDLTPSGGVPQFPLPPPTDDSGIPTSAIEPETGIRPVNYNRPPSEGRATVRGR